ncbi:N-methyl-L-tryptophan oxidase [Paenibacillus barengoltzii]|uniref:Sarcosine oxidase, monomeric form n=1 Tax=Paenibacillus barengoltzii G22 TaxID=1235795 RepID=R9LGS9_9BACL|nr:N-methyl-L-tryptophan oxidase [Paenibacillus barengoltzii]EOS54947.1 sarcosine oxidase, monomeric form [Paenibacillus barengoltzii G22]
MSASIAYDVIVVGAGSMGMSAGYYLARKGLRTLLIDAFDPPHREGSHHGEPRLIRHAYSGDPVYTELAVRAHRLWNEVEELTGTQLLVSSGVLNLADRGVYSFKERMAQSAALGVHTEWLDAAEIRARWPELTIPDSFEAMYEPHAGYLYSERCVEAYRQLALAQGAKLLTYAIVRDVKVHQGEGGVTVYTADDRFHAGAVLLTAGAWFSTLSPFVNLPIRAVRKVVGWFETSGPGFDAGRFPGFTLGTPEGGFYGFPNIGGAGLKIGRHDGGVPWTPGETLAPFGSRPEDEADLRRVLSAYMPKAAGRLKQGAVCKYEMSPDEDFIIDRHPEHPQVWVAGGFSGHGFKFASAIGARLADLIAEGKRDDSLRPFALDRFGQLAK